MHLKNRYYYITLVSLFLVSSMNILFSLMIKFLVDSLMNQSISDFILYLILLVFSMIILLFFEFVQQFFSKKFINQMGEEVHKGIVDSLILDNGGAQDKMGYLSSISNDIETVKELYFENQLTVAQGIFSLILSIFAIFSLDFLTAIFVLIFSFLPIVIPYIFSKKLTSLQNNISETKAEYTGTLTDFLEGLTIIKNSKSVTKFREILLERYTQVSRRIEARNSLSAFGNTLIGLTFYATTVFILGIGGWQVLNGAVTVGSIVAIYSISSELVSPINQIAAGIGDMNSSKDILHGLMRNVALKQDEELLKDKDIKFFGLTIKNLIFKVNDGTNITYPENVGPIEHHKKYLIKGKNGSGKSTLLEIVIKNKESYSGLIEINGKPLETYGFYQIQHLIAYVPQKPYLFHDTYFNNITLYQTVNEEYLWSLIDIFGLRDRFPDRESLEESYGKGSDLSGGQVQKIGIIRALLQEKQVLFLDESFSAIDRQSSQSIQEYLLSMNELTLLHVSHQDSGLGYDGIIKLDNK
ncbi:ABC-type multidrug/protein/lipid transport system, ATPase component [Streptococcus sp. DD13]|nr:ABC transporter ATP-binding protein [Streptococcus sp. DD13]KXT77882.1 ABC-type multidrug/protein/lipid transport system, ATPase component [Streptococcus sp. DD13]